MSDETPCSSRKDRSIILEQEIERFQKRCARLKIAPTCFFVSYAFNCNDKRHESSEFYHLDFCAKIARGDIPNGVQATVEQLKHLVATIEKAMETKP